MTPETKARIKIDKKLEEAGYVVQDFKEFNHAASLGVVVREYPTSSGPVDYLIFVNKIPAIPHIKQYNKLTRPLIFIKSLG